MDDSRKIFQAIAHDLENRNRFGKGLTVECDRVLNDIVRPAIREASEAIKAGEIQFNDANHQPFILVQRPVQPHDEIRFICMKKLEILTHVDGKSQESTFDLGSVSQQLIVQHIERFLRQTLRLQAGDQ